MDDIKTILRNFAQFYGQECWQNGKQGIRELPNGDELIEIFSKKLSDILSQSIDEKKTISN